MGAVTERKWIRALILCDKGTVQAVYRLASTRSVMPLFCLCKGLSMKNQIIGKTVVVTVDRPIGSKHPKYNNIIYPINYGYIEGIIAPDGEEQDAYIVGVNIPLKQFTGKVIAIIHRKNDIENKWVVAPDNISFSSEEIIHIVNFQEKFFNSEIIM